MIKNLFVLAALVLMASPSASVTFLQASAAPTVFAPTYYSEDFENANPTDCADEDGISHDTSGGDADCASTTVVLEGSESLEFTGTFVGDEYVRAASGWTQRVTTGITEMRMDLQLDAGNGSSGEFLLYRGYDGAGADGFNIRYQDSTNLLGVECGDGTDAQSNTAIVDATEVSVVVVYDHDNDDADFFQAAKGTYDTWGTPFASCNGTATGGDVAMDGHRIYYTNSTPTIVDNVQIGPHVVQTAVGRNPYYEDFESGFPSYLAFVTGSVTGSAAATASGGIATFDSGHTADVISVHMVDDETYSVDQWGAIEVGAQAIPGRGDAAGVGFFFRQSQAGKEGYQVLLLGNGNYSIVETGQDGTGGGGNVSTASLGNRPVDGDKLGVCLHGTGGSIEFKIWDREPADASFPSCDGSTCAADCGWGTPDFTIGSIPGYLQQDTGDAIGLIFKDDYQSQGFDGFPPELEDARWGSN